MGQGKAGPPLPGPCQALPLLCPGGWHGAGLGGSAGRGAAARGPREPQLPLSPHPSARLGGD